jgi:hypothetical protein
MKKESGFYKLRKHILVILLLAVAGRGTLCGQGTSPASAIPAQQTQAQQQTLAQGPQPGQQTQAETAAKARPELARMVIDMNPFMWIFSGILDENNNRSIFFDIGVQYNISSDVAVRVNPSFSFGFTGETAFSDAPLQFFEIDIPLSLFCFPFPDDTYLDVLFFGISVLVAYHSTMDTNTAFLSIGALLEVGYQLKLSNHLAITPSIGVSRMFPKLIEGDEYVSPNFNLYSPWTADTPIAPRARLTVGFWF